MQLSAFDYNSIPAGYYDQVFLRNRGVQSNWHHQKFARVRSEISVGSRVLDVGCGPGTFLGTLPDSTLCLGLDIAKSQIEYANIRYATNNRSFGLMSPGHLPVSDNSVDVVTIIELLEHIPEEEAVLLVNDCRRVLRTGGTLVVTTPNYGSIWPALEYVTNRLGKLSYRDQHVTHYQAASLDRLLNRAGLVDSHVEAYLFSAPFFASLSWSLAYGIAKVEPGCITRRFGHLLIGRAVKP